MSNNDKTPAPNKKTARVRVLKNRLRVGDFYHAEGAEIPDMSLEEYEIRQKANEVELISVNS